MQIRIKSALAFLFMASLPLHMRAAAPQSSSDVNVTASEARTPADHARLALYYKSKAQVAQAKLADAEEQMKHYSFMADRTKVPNAYTSSRTLVERYRAEVEENAKLAADQQRMAEPQQASAK